MNIYQLEPYSQKSFYGKAMVVEEGNKRTLISYETEMLTVEYGSVIEFNRNEYNYSRTTMKHVNDFLQRMGMSRTNLEEVRLSIKNGDWYDE